MKKRRILAIVLCVILLTATALSAFSVARITLTGHACHGESCHVCAVVNTVLTALLQKAAVLIPVAALVLMLLNKSFASGKQCLMPDRQTYISNRLLC